MRLIIQYDISGERNGYLINPFEIKTNSIKNINEGIFIFSSGSFDFRNASFNKIGFNFSFYTNLKRIDYYL